MENEPIECGALWERTDKRGILYWKGVVTIDGKDTELLMFTNNDQAIATAPKFRLKQITK